MIDLRAASIAYQAQGYLIDLVDSLITNKKLGKALNKDWDKADRIIHYLEAYQHRDKLDDPTDVNYILECVIQLAQLYQFPAAPTLVYPDAPAIIIGIPGPPGPRGPAGNNGATGLATDITTVISTTGPVDTFPITDAKGARWDYVVVRNGTLEQRSGFVYGTWSEDGASIDFFDNSTADLVGPTTPISFEVQYNGTNIQLIAVITEGTWSIFMTRYFTPNNGNGTGPVSSNLSNGLIWIGNELNKAQERQVSGVINMTNDGTVDFTPLIIDDNDISLTAGITLTKLATLDPSRIVITSPLGYLDTTGVPTLTELSYLATARSNIQVQIDAKLNDPTTNVGDMIYRNGDNVIARLGAGTQGQVLTMQGGLPTWSNAGGSLQTTVVEIGDWDMDNVGGLVVTLPGVTANRIRAVHGVIRTDVGSLLGETYYPIGGPYEGGAVYVAIQGWGPSGSDTNIVVTRTAGTVFDSTSFDATGYNRGWLTVTHS